MAATLVPLLGLLYGTVHKAVGNSLHSLTHPQVTTEQSAHRYSSKKTETVCSHKDLHVDVHCSCIRNMYKLEVTQMSSTSEWTKCGTPRG